MAPATQKSQVFFCPVGFLNEELQDKVSVEQPQGFIIKGLENRVYKLEKELYGLKQAPTTWSLKSSRCRCPDPMPSKGWRAGCLISWTALIMLQETTGGSFSFLYPFVSYPKQGGLGLPSDFLSLLVESVMAYFVSNMGCCWLLVLDDERLWDACNSSRFWSMVL